MNSNMQLAKQIVKGLLDAIRQDKTKTRFLQDGIMHVELRIIIPEIDDKKLKYLVDLINSALDQYIERWES